MAERLRLNRPICEIMNESDLSGFFAYPSASKDISESIRATCLELKRQRPSSQLQTWEANDIAGYCLTDPIISQIRQSKLLIADITRLNFNVIYEIGYAIGLRKRVFLVRNRSVVSDQQLAREVGIFDTMGYEDYSNSTELVQIIKGITSFAPLPLSDAPLNKKVPVYILTPREKAEAEIQIISRVKKAGGIGFRSFDPVENARLSVRTAIENVCSSVGVILPLLASSRADAHQHNLRCAFVAGLAHALEKETLVMQAGGEPVPLDLRDYVKVFDTLDSINGIIANFVRQVVERVLAEDEFVLSESATPLQDLFLGQSAAENEMVSLNNYFLKTDEFNRVANGDVNLVAGRKGSGKTALFFQTRNHVRRHKHNIVLDLNPEGFQLNKFKDLVLQHMAHGTKEHTVTAFWEYLLFLELAYKLLEKDHNTFQNDNVVRDHYKKVSALYNTDQFSVEGDFAERMLKLTQSIADAFETQSESTVGAISQKQLTRPQITEFIYCHNLKELRDAVVEYLKLKQGVWILFDNIDKGWHAHGVDEEDLMILRCLLDALSKLRREISRSDVPCNTIVFIRNDVYELLVGSMPDRGKFSKIALDWTDPDMLREVLRRRFVSNIKDKTADFSTIWRNIAESHIFGGQESSQYVIDRCLMRPRALIDFLNHAKAHAINLRHTKILEDDFREGERAYSTDLINQIDLEIQDIYPKAENSLYAFIEAPGLLDERQLHGHFDRLNLPPGDYQKMIELFLWYGFLGILREDGTPTYIYDINYEMRKLIALKNKRAENDMVYLINPAFWSGLDIKNS